MIFVIYAFLPKVLANLINSKEINIINNNKNTFCNPFKKIDSIEKIYDDSGAWLYVTIENSIWKVNSSSLTEITETASGWNKITDAILQTHSLYQVGNACDSADKAIWEFYRDYRNEAQKVKVNQNDTLFNITFNMTGGWIGENELDSATQVSNDRIEGSLPAIYMTKGKR